VKTELTVTVDYDSNVTDPESLASAMDRLLETILSTPGILDEYGNPRVGEFFVLRRGRKQRAKASLNAVRRWAIYDLDTGQLLSTQLFGNYREALEEAAQVDDAIVVPLVVQGVKDSHPRSP
jgi:hypothetical protein